MIPIQFEYVVPHSIDEAVKLLQADRQAVPLAGGQSLLTAMKLRQIAPTKLVDLSKIPALAGLNPAGNGLRLGAMTTLAQVVAAAQVQQGYPALVEAIYSIGDPQVRNRATLGGSLAANHPAGDLPAVALALGAVINTAGPGGTRAILADQFLTGGFQTGLQPGEVITSVDLPAAAGSSAYEKFKNPASGYAICSAAAAVEVSNGVISGCRVTVAGATRGATRLSRVEAALAGQAATAENLAAAAQWAAEGLSFASDLAASAEYRAYLAGVLVERALSRAAARARGSK